MEDTVDDSSEEAGPVDTGHRNWDPIMEATPEGAHFLSSVPHLPGVKRRKGTRLGCSRVPFLEPIGGSREEFYESKLVLASSPGTAGGNGGVCM